MGKNAIDSNLGGWIAYTREDPREALHAIYKRALVKIGVMAFDIRHGEYLELEGLKIEIDNEAIRSIEDFLEDGIYHKMRVCIIDREKIQLEFFDFWKELVADGVVRDGPPPEAKEWFTQEVGALDKTTMPDINQIISENEVILEKFGILWRDRYPRRSVKGSNAQDWMRERGAPSWLTYKMMQRKAKELGGGRKAKKQKG